MFQFTGSSAAHCEHIPTTDSFTLTDDFHNLCSHHCQIPPQSSVHQLLYGVTQASVLGLLFILYTTPPSTFISKSFVHHHLHADDTQLFISFSSTKFLENVFFLLKTQLLKSLHRCLQIIVCLKKTEFLLIDLPNNFPKLRTLLSLPFLQSPFGRFIGSQSRCFI
jgi:hypothetical protein